MLIVYEGIDGSGKSTSSRELCTSLEDRGLTASVVQWTSFMLRRDEENPWFRVPEQRRERGALGPLAYAVWHCADFADRIERFVLPALRRGEIVIMDRYAYTALVRDVIRGVDEQVVRSLYTFAPAPEVVIHLDVDPALAYERKKASAASIGYYERGLDLFPELGEKEGFIAFQSLCRARYPSVLPPSTLRFDGSRPRSELSAAILGAVEATLERNALR